jgi:nitroimidazol reductase NimA-like FMN-containing flavoprotein (pyridoxamine 5'-phosphate oxidase superfamily)|uniref:Putative Pyridoxamine 5'-phosphate oxidase n=1 Tax=uncultured marine crenarchaeote HF4000_APKG5N21 TaxID=455593 RepID=B3T8P6_9ARCH|nr:putative Pyridoxamine 5'-phosphate oxidase [uncultured marine crenarchaeote HF4000_APKG5N21]
MQLLGKLEIKSKEKIIEFLSSQQTGRISSIDENGYPQIIPMNFVFINDIVYMHSHIKGEKLENIKRNQKVGFEVDKSLEFLPSYFSDPTDASLADTLYISVIIKGNASIISDKEEKTIALNGLMKKYQPEGGYEPIKPDMDVLNEVEVIKIVPESLRGKYKIGQHMDRKSRIDLARQILERNSPTAKETLDIMGFEIIDNEPKLVDDKLW